MSLHSAVSKFLVSCILLYSLFHADLSAQPDSTNSVPPGRLVSSALLGSLATSYSTSKNFTAWDYQNIAFSGSLFWQHDVQVGQRAHSHKVLADLSYLKFIDSTWAKGVDRVQANFLWSRKASKWTHSYSAMLATQFLPNEVQRYDAFSDGMVIERIGGTFSPGIFELSYGATWNPWPMSSLQFSFATVRLLANPKAAMQRTDAEHLAVSGNTVFDMQYGGSVLVAINRQLNERLLWVHSSRAFCNAFDRDHVTFELMNRFGFKIWRYLQLRLDTRMGYDPLFSYDLRFSQEVLFGFFYERRK